MAITCSIERPATNTSGTERTINITCSACVYRENDHYHPQYTETNGYHLQYRETDDQHQWYRENDEYHLQCKNRTTLMTTLLMNDVDVPD